MNGFYLSGSRREAAGEPVWVQTSIQEGADIKRQDDRLPSLGSVLLMEDEPLVALDLAGILEQIGFAECVIVDSRREAVDLYGRKEFGLVLADVRLRDGDDGIAIVRELRRQRPVPVVFVTGNVESVRSAGLDMFPIVGKPFGTRAIVRAVKVAMNPEQ